ncbi:MAG: S8 family peptidase [Candidatus Poseidoniaceae archaeon]
MASSRRYIISSALFIQLLMLSAVASPLADGVNPLGDLTKMNDDLLEELENNDNSKLIPVIFQLNSPMTESDEKHLIELGFEVLGRAPLVDGGLVEGTIGEVRELSNWERIEYLELDKPLEFFYLPSEWGGEPTTDAGIMMHETTHVVTATDSWSRAIISPTGEVEYEIDQSFTEWDGDGTAIVDLDTGVDAGHPDYDYLEPWTGDKAIYSAKFDGVGWTETRNSDTSSGHGTHVGGTIAGNGDASSGRRAGVAKGGQLVALGTGDGASIFAAEQGLEWTYAHSIPGQNQHHIRVVSNSWGTDGDYNPQGVIAQLTDKLTYENGVAVIFAASNSGGSGAECSGDLRTNVYANTPSAVSVAALTHDGTAVTSFSSRGCMNQQHTWPDVGAPGRDIWATAPRGTAIDASTRTQGDLYYMAISGTSMATPHVGGIAGLVLNAAPSLGVADYHRDDHDFGDSLVGGDGTAAYGQYENWDSENYSRVHEFELILELTSRYDGMANSCEDGNSEDGCADIPEECYRSATGGCHDWRVGHGLTDTDAAVALARTLQLMRDQNGDGFVDHPEYNVWDAYEIYQEMMGTATIPVNTDRVKHSWKGDWNHFNNGANGAVYYTEDSHYVFIPNGTERLEATLAASEFELETAQAGQLQLSIDLGEDGSNDGQGQGIRIADTWYYDLDVDSSHWGKWAHFDVTGQAITLFGVIEDPEFFESRIPYTVDVLLTLDLSQPVDIAFEQRPDFYSDLDPALPSEVYDSDNDGKLTFTRLVYDQAAVVALIKPKDTGGEEGEDGFFSSLTGIYTEYPLAMSFLSLILVVALVGLGYSLKESNNRVVLSHKEYDDDVLEAEMAED